MAIPVPEGWSTPIGGEATPNPCTGGGGGGGTPECPECPGPGPLVLTVVCCPTEFGCILDCNQPVLIKACNGTPPYAFFSGDDDFMTVTQVEVDMAVVNVRLKYTQFVYKLRYQTNFTVFSDPDGRLCQPTSSHPDVPSGGLVSIMQINRGYDCNLVELPHAGGWGDLLVDTEDCVNCDCFDPDNQPGQTLNVSAIIHTGLVFMRGDVITGFRLYSANPVGLDIHVIVDGVHFPFSAAFPANDIVVPTGVYGIIPHDPIDAIVEDALGAQANITFTF